MTKLTFQPRIIRAKLAPGYLGMCRDVFNKVVRPYVREFPIGGQGIGFDRVELDKWADAYIEENSIEKPQRVEAPPPLFDAPQSVRKQRGPAMLGQRSSLSARKPPTSEDFYKLIDEILGRSGVKKDRRPKKLSSRLSDQ
ncbi:hypothetical protein LOY43_20245 [Pseudomonas sp. B21-041]|uniref:hypothetical protein n=1 Tax=Pseudomonas sp. B21-041 TaxID=2895487 RepID=UPI00215FCE3D|nr:hypothetical protein [Pseudomonas sp. B21-041]UVL33284.1 hypothetical protein LOY43_20245 [Pseudomonas sp. B21-041]